MAKKKLNPKKELRPFRDNVRSLFNGMITETERFYPSIKTKEVDLDDPYPGTSAPPEYTINRVVFRKFIEILKRHIECQRLVGMHAHSYRGLSLDKKPKVPFVNGFVQLDPNSDISEEDIQKIYAEYCTTRFSLSEYGIEELHQHVDVGGRSKPFINMRYVSSPESFRLWAQFIKLIYAYYHVPFYYPLGRPQMSHVYTPEVLEAFNVFVKESKLDKENKINAFDAAFLKTVKKFPELKDVLQLSQLIKMRKPSFKLKDDALHPRPLWIRVTRK